MGCASSNQSVCVGIPYKVEGAEIKVVVIKKGGQWLFPEGGCRSGETVEDAVMRITGEKAGVGGDLGEELPLGSYSNVQVFPVSYTGEVGNWPEPVEGKGKRKWLISDRAQNEVDKEYMQQALTVLVDRLRAPYR